jgi:DNA-binding protein WhiA
LAGRGKIRVVYETENSALAKRIFLLLKRRMEITPQLQFNRHKRLGGRRLSILTVPEAESRRLLIALRMIQESESGTVYKGVPRAAMTRRCCRAAFIRASFLGGGSVTSPDQEYRMEFISSDTRSDTLIKMLAKSNIEAKTAKRRDGEIVYIRRGDDVVACLALMGAHRALLNMENTRISRDARNRANRARNCDEANLKKQLSAGEAQAQAITAYSLAHSLGGLPQALQELGRLRMLHPEASLEELGQMLAKPIGKSGVNHRMRALMNTIQDNQRQNGDENDDQADAGFIGCDALEPHPD